MNFGSREIRRSPLTYSQVHQYVGDMRHWKITTLAMLVSWTLGSCALAANISSQNFDQFNTAFMEIVKPGSEYFNEERPVYPVWSRVLLMDFLKYNPNPNEEATSPECNSLKWLDENRQRSSLAGLTDGSTSIMESVGRYVQRCDDQMRSDWVSSLFSGYFAMMIKWNQKTYPYGRYVLFHLPNGNRVKGFLALKGDGTKRPLIILRLGIFADVTKFAPERFMFLQLFEQSPFNVLILESNSGNEYVFRNKKISIGGFEEGIQDFLIAKKLQDPSEPLSNIIESIHMMAFSMGGHGALFASLLSDWQAKKDLAATKKPHPVIQSLLAYCPLINFRETLDFHLSQGPQSKVFNYWMSHRLRGVEQVIPEIDPDHFFQSVVDHVDQNYLGPAAYDESLPLKAKMKEDLHKFWSENLFWEYYHDVQTPVLILATELDPIVPFALNSQRLLNHYMDVGNSQLKVVSFKAGVHCGLPGVYQWRPLASITQAFFLREANFIPEKMSRPVQLSREEVVGMKAKTFPPKYEIQEGRSPAEFYLNLELSDQPLVIKSIGFSFKDMGYADSDFTVSRPMIERWLAQNLRFELSENAQQPPQLVLSWYR